MFDLLGPSQSTTKSLLESSSANAPTTSEARPKDCSLMAGEGAPDPSRNAKSSASRKLSFVFCFLESVGWKYNNDNVKDFHKFGRKVQKTKCGQKSNFLWKSKTFFVAIEILNARPISPPINPPSITARLPLTINRKGETSTWIAIWITQQSFIAHSFILCSFRSFPF